MFSSPMFHYEYQAATRKRRPFVFRTVVAVVLGLVTVLIGLLVFKAHSGQGGPDEVLLFGRSVFITTFGTELLFMVFFVPAFVAGSIAEERARDTLPLLLLSRLTRIEIVLTKTTARWLPTLSLILTGLPVLAASAWVAGLEVQLSLALLVLLSSSALMATLAILASTVRELAAPARTQATFWCLGWLILPPILSIMPIRTTNLWGILLAELKALCALIAPSSPLSLATDRSWYFRPGSVSLQARVAPMIGLQALFGLVALGFTVSRLKVRETNPNWVDPTQGHRPPCSDDPIYWREYELPMRQGSGSLTVLRLRYVLIIIKAILINVLILLTTLLALAIPIGLTVATMYYGVAAFKELRQYGMAGPFVDRTHFNFLVRATTGLIALIPSLNQTSLVGTRIKSERDKKTWDALLTTPLGGREILWSKTRVVQAALWPARPLLVIWALGLTCGVVVPLGVLLAAIDLFLLTWALLALAFYSSIRPDPTSVVSSRSVIITLILLVTHTALLGVALASPPELAVFALWDVRLRWGLILTIWTIPILTGVFAWVLTRRTLDRFDEWVGRPIRPEADQREVESPGHAARLASSHT